MSGGRCYLTHRTGLLAGVPVDQPASEMNRPAMVVEVHTGPCPDPGSSPGVSTKNYAKFVSLGFSDCLCLFAFFGKEENTGCESFLSGY